MHRQQCSISFVALYIETLKAHNSNKKTAHRGICPASRFIGTLILTISCFAGKHPNPSFILG